MTIINLTPHTINFVDGDGAPILDVPASGSLARVSAYTVPLAEIDGIPVTATAYGEVTGLPEPQDGVCYVVSALVAQRVPDRDDVFVPAESVRDANGRIVGCRSLGRVR